MHRGSHILAPRSAIPAQVAGKAEEIAQTGWPYFLWLFSLSVFAYAMNARRWLLDM
jgi:hypothetical protein